MNQKTIRSLLGCLVAAVLLGSSVLAEDDDSTFVGWRKSLIVDLTATQAAYSNSWEGGEAGSFSWVGNLNGTAEKHLSSRVHFKSQLKLSFGQTVTQDEETKDWSKPVKSTDLIDWENVARFTLGGFVDPYAAFRLESRFLNASDKANQHHFDPIRLTESGGIARVFKDDDMGQVVSRLGLAIRQTIAYEVDSAMPYSRVTATDGGLESVTDATLQLTDKLKYTGKLTLFKAFFYSEKDKVEGLVNENYWKAVDVDWENIINASITKIISVNFYTQLLYDKQINLKGRFKETLGIGFVFNLI